MFRDRTLNAGNHGVMVIQGHAGILSINTNVDP